MMPLSPFNIPKPDTRIVIHDNQLFKVKLIYKPYHESQAVTLPCRHSTAQREVTKVIKCIIALTEENPTLKIQTRHFWVEYYLRPWGITNKLDFIKDGQTLQVYPQILHIIMAPKSDASEEEPACLIEATELMNKTVPSKRPRVSENTEKDATTDKRQKVTADDPPSSRRGKTSSVQPRQHVVGPSGDAFPQDPSHHRKERPQRNLKEVQSHGTSSAAQHSDTIATTHRPTTAQRTRTTSEVQHSATTSAVQRSRTKSEVQHSAVHGTTSASQRPASVSSNRRDRTLIELEDRREEMKLRQLTQTSASTTVDDTAQPDRPGLFDIIITPVKKLLRM